MCDRTKSTDWRSKPYKTARAPIVFSGDMTSTSTAPPSDASADGSATPADRDGEHSGVDDAVLVERAVELARRLLTESIAGATPTETRRQKRLGSLLEDDDGREMIFALTDQVMRIESPDHAAERFAAVVRDHPTTATGRVDRLLMRAGAIVAPRLPRVVMPLVVKRIKHETRGIVLPADDPAFADHLAERAGDGVRINVNPLGEAILSDAEADERLRSVRERIVRPDVDYVSVKVSAIVANLDALAFDHSLERICDRLRTVYRTAASAEPRTFVNLDMEEYRDLELTLQSFMRVLDEPEFRRLDAGIVLQAYLPDSHGALERLGDWAATRRREGGGRVKVRLVKGANLAMEQAEAELHGWTAAPYGTKADVDASFKAMLDSALRPEWSDAIRIGLASHNLFDVAWALTLGSARGALDRMEFEMLEGMAPAQARAVHAAAGGLLMYAPVVADDDFDASIAYLTRRLDENTQPDNFLRSLFTLTPDSPLFADEADRFRDAVAARHTVATDRRRAPVPVQVASDGVAPDGVAPDGDGDGDGEAGARPTFRNEPEADFTDPSVRGRIVAATADPPQPEWTVLDGDDALDAVDAVIATATAAAERDDHDLDTRRGWLLAVADLMSSERTETIGLLATTAAKTAHEADPEISEAIDFCRYYPTAGRAALDEAVEAGLEVGGRGTVVVVGPWNFPYAIPTGGVAAAIAAGNSVVLKPAPEVVAVGAHIADQFWRAGVSRDVLQLVVCEDGPVGTHLVTHPDVDTVVLTGAHATASMFLDWKPDLRLFAETSGKDALVVTASADLDLAIADLVRSAFGHAGQKCSAASLGIVTADVYDDPSFRRRLRDAVTSLRVGPASDPASMVGPLIQPPSGPLLRALTSLDPGESWLVEPRPLDDPDPTSASLWSPGVRLDVAEGSWFHRTECFGPVLGLVRADDLDHAIRLQNATAFGLTGGIHSLDDDEVARWLDRVEIGNAYVNRHITGAVVQRQPFGGWKRSVVGGGAKAGGPGYVAQFAHVVDPAIDLAAARSSFAEAWTTWFGVDHDPTGLAVESNVLRHVPLSRVAVRHDGAPSGDAAGPLDVIRLAASTSGVRLVESSASVESDVGFAERVAKGGVERVRLLTTLADEARRVLHAADVAIDTTPPVTDGRLELQHWVKEQAISRTTHRHGRLID